MKFVCRISAILLCAFAVTCACAEQKAASLYKTSCAQCHGTTGEADTPAGKAFNARSLKSPEVLKMSDEEMLALTKKGKGKMPAWEEVLSDDELKSVIAYIHTLQKSNK
jgi:mono/diheme cytochrome c family protein